MWFEVYEYIWMQEAVGIYVYLFIRLKAVFSIFMCCSHIASESLHFCEHEIV